jgi:metal-responsive CopG/Arc/MetJ family transcriptional regulator
METPLKAISIKIPRELLETIDRIAEKNKTTRSAVIRRVLSRYIEMLEKGITIIPKSKGGALEKKIITSFRIHTEDLEKLDRISKETDIRRSTLIRWVIEHYIETQIETQNAFEMALKEKHIVIKI